MAITRNGIYYNLEESTYTHKEGKITFYFSSRNNLEKFKEQINDNRNVLTYSLYKRFKMWVITNELYDIVLYSKIEKRGFRINVDGVDYRCLKNLKLDGVKRIEQR